MIRHDIPRIETERLILRAPRESDFDAFASFGASDRAKWVGGPYSRARSWGGFLAMFGHWALRGYGFWMLETRADAGIAGRVGFARHDGWDEPELGWHIFEGFEGRGIAFEAARAHAARHLGLNGVISYIAHANTRSRALAERLGAHIEREAELLGKPCQIWRHPMIGGA